MADDVLRKRTQRAAIRELTEDTLAQLIRDAFDATKAVVCQHCNRTTRVPMPDVNALAKIIEALEGKLAPPEQTVHHDVTVMSLPERIRYLEALKARRLELGSGDEAA